VLLSGICFTIRQSCARRSYFGSPELPEATIIVDAGVGTASDATIAMELGADAVLMNTATS
jgi:hypothetical protein